MPTQIGNSVAPELPRSQIELVSPVFERHEQAVEEMVPVAAGHCRNRHGEGASSDCFGNSPDRALPRVDGGAKRPFSGNQGDFLIVGRRDVLRGLHVHVAVPADVDRVILTNRVMHWLPVFLALSTSSPFWNRTAMGLLSYRQSAYDEWPRTGIPDHFRDKAG